MSYLTRPAAYIAALAVVVALVAVVAAAGAGDAIERLRCEGQVAGTAANHPGSNCGYQLTPSETEFRFAIDDGSQRILYLSGGTEAGPDAVRLLRDGQVVSGGPTSLMQADRNIDVCRNQPPRDVRWWSRGIDDEIAAALRQGSGTYTLEGRVAGQWRPLRVHDSGCKWRGHA